MTYGYLSYSPIRYTWVLCLLRGLPLSILCHSLHSPSPLGWASPNSVFPPLSFKDYCLFPLAFAWWLPFREMRTRLRVRNTFIMYALELQGWFTAQLPLVAIHPQCSAYPPQGKRKRDFLKCTFLLRLSSREHLFVLVCGQSIPSSATCDSSGGAGTRWQDPQSHKKPSSWSLLSSKGNPLIESGGKKSNKFSSLLRRFGEGQGEGRREKQHVKISLFPIVQDQEHGRTDKLATLPYLLFRFQEL